MAKILYYDNGTPKEFKDIGYIDFKEATLKDYLDVSQSARGLFANFYENSINHLISYSDTENVKNASRMFYHCSNLVSIPELDFSNVESMDETFSYCASLERIGIKHIKCTFYLYDCNRLNRAALIEIFNNLDNVTGDKTIWLSSNQMSLLSADDIAIATNKGWRIEG